MDSMRCQQCSQTFCSRYNLLRHIRNKHLQHDALFETPRTTLEAAPGAHLGAPGAHLGAPGAHLGAPGAHLGAPGAHLGAPGAHLGAPGAHLGAPGAHLGAHLGAPGAHLGAPPPPQGAPGAHLGAHSPPQPQRAPLLQEDSKNSIQPTFLLHPFTMMISGPTACGKNTLVKELLQKHSTRIKPLIQRIVWLYKRWQPMYDVIRTTVVPKVEFVQGIPVDLEVDDFFDPRVNNLLILDDLFSEAGKDKRITDLFTEGSHHRSLSVISINQNLFSNKDPTQRRNCHYLVLFNNPVDRQTIMTLARQMYPGNTEKFQKAFAKATKNPYGYLLLDLKPFTSENDRLKSDIMWPEKSQDMIVLPNQIQESTQAAIKEDNSYDINHYSVGDQTVHIEQENMMADKGQACDDCGLLFDSTHDLQRHIKRGWCPENNEPPAKKAKIEDETDDDVEDNEGYKHLWHLAQACNKERFSKLYDQYIDDGENEDDAADMATQRIQPCKENNFLGRYQSLLEKYWFPLRTNPTHRAIIEKIENLRSKGTSLKSALKKVLKKNKNNFEELFETADSDDEENEVKEDTEDVEME